MSSRVTLTRWPSQVRRCCKLGTNGGEARVVDVLADHPRHLLFLALARGKRTPPFPERAVAVGDRREPHMGDVVEQRNRRIQQAIAEKLCSRSESVSRRSRSSDPSRRKKCRTQPSLSALCPRSIALLATAGCQRSWPLKSRRNGPHAIGRRVDDRSSGRCGSPPQPPNCRFRASKPPWKTPLPIFETSSASRSGGQSNSAVHSAKVRSPSVIGVSRSVAT